VSEDDCEEIKGKERRDKRRSGNKEEIRNQEEIAELRLVVSDIARGLKELQETFQANNQDQTATPIRNKRIRPLNLS
jgi:hypothetical protein